MRACPSHTVISLAARPCLPLEASFLISLSQSESLVTADYAWNPSLQIVVFATFGHVPLSDTAVIGYAWLCFTMPRCIKMEDQTHIHAINTLILFFSITYHHD